MEIIVCAMKDEALSLQKHFGNSVQFVNCGVYAKRLDFLKKLSPGDHVTNIGVCAGSNVGEIYLCNKLIGTKTYYPDLLIPNKLNQSEIKTVNYLVGAEEIAANPNTLYDQEAAVIFAEAQKYIAPHQISFLKIVSDSGVSNFDEVRKTISKLIENRIPEIEELLASSRKFFEKIKPQVEIKNLDRYAEQLKCTATMKAQLARLLRYAQIANIDVSKFISNKNPTTKQESLQLINSLQTFLLS